MNALIKGQTIQHGKNENDSKMNDKRINRRNGKKQEK